MLTFRWQMADGNTHLSNYYIESTIRMRLFCAVVGQKQNLFSVVIEETKSVDELKETIVLKQKYDFAPSMLDLYLAKANKDSWLHAGTDVVRNLADENTEMVKNLTHARQPLNPADSLQDVLSGMPIPELRQIHILVVITKPLPSMSSSQIFSPFRPLAEGLDLEYPHLSREKLLQDLYTAVSQTNFTLLSAPAGSGKTSLMTMFAEKYPEFRHIPVHNFSTSSDPIETLYEHGLDLIKGKCSIQDERKCVFMLDDCQRQYKNIDFWCALLKGSSSKLPKNSRYIISATHLLEVDMPESPVEFDNIEFKLTSENFKITDDEAREFLYLQNGLLPEIRHKKLMDIMIRECNGLVAALRISCNSLYRHFKNADSKTEEDTLLYFKSGAFASRFGRCFGKGHNSPSIEFQSYLIRCLLRDPTCPPFEQNVHNLDTNYMLRLKKAGILKQDEAGNVLFTSIMAERFYSQYLFPNRAPEFTAQTLPELISMVVESMPASVLRQSVVGNNAFPKEAVFQHLFMVGLALKTPPTCNICPEMSRVFQESSNELSEHINGRINFYINGNRRWGIELLVNGDRIGGHMARFEEGGRYFALRVRDYIVVDLRRQFNRNFSRYPKKMTIFFQDDFSSCNCYYGLEGESFKINLPH